MEIEQNIIERNWHVNHRGRTYYVNYLESDGQTLALLNRDNWRIQSEDGNDLGIYPVGHTRTQKEKAARKLRMFDKLVDFCIQNWDNKFMKKIKEEFEKC